MYLIRNFTGRNEDFSWKHVTSHSYEDSQFVGISKQFLFDKKVEKSDFEIRFYHFKAGSKGDLARHDRDYAFFILKGKAFLRINEEIHIISVNDFVYISANELIQIFPDGKEDLGFLCITNQR